MLLYFQFSDCLFTWIDWSRRKRDKVPICPICREFLRTNSSKELQFEVLKMKRDLKRKHLQLNFVKKLLKKKEKELKESKIELELSRKEPALDSYSDVICLN